MRKTLRLATLAGTVLALGAVTAISTGGLAQGGTLNIEVAETGSRFAPDLDFLDDGGNPLRGGYFVTEGYIYESGTLTCADGSCNGVLYDEAGNASPEFPDSVIGTWTCYGVHVEDAATLESGAIVVTTQIFDLGESVGSDMIVSDGFELIDLDTPFSRAITGGTGDYAGAGGVQTQTFIGLNNAETMVDGIPLFGFSLSVELATE